MGWRVGGPDDVALGQDGSVCWTDILTGEVGRLAPDGTTSKQLVGEGVNPIAFPEDGRLFVSDANAGAVYVFAGGRGVRTLVKGGLILPGGVAVVPRTDESESLYIGDGWRLVEHDARSGRLTGIDSQDFADPAGIIAPSTAAPDAATSSSPQCSPAPCIWDPRADQALATFTDFLFPPTRGRRRAELPRGDDGGPHHLPDHRGTGPLTPAHRSQLPAPPTAGPGSPVSEAISRTACLMEVMSLPSREVLRQVRRHRGAPATDRSASGNDPAATAPAGSTSDRSTRPESP
jgi:hypothetical protein